MGTSFDTLIDQHTGAVLEKQIQASAIVRAHCRYGADATDRDVDRYEDELRGIAGIMRNRWRKDHGLPDDTHYVNCTAYGKARDGLRRSAF